MSYSIFVEVDLKIAILDAIIGAERKSRELFTAYILHRLEGIREMELTFKAKSLTGQIPDEVWAVLLDAGANLNDEQKRQLKTWRQWVTDMERLLLQ